MKLNRTGANWDRLERNKINENWDIIEGLGGKVDNIVDEISDEAFEKIVDSAKLDWKEPVDSFGDLPSEADEGEVRMVRDTGKVYRYDGTNWKEIQEIDATAINEVDSRLTQQLAETDAQIYKNAMFPLAIQTYDGSNQATHPDAIYFPDGWNGSKFWKVITPYPYNDNTKENPSILRSHDGVFWEAPTGLTNPIDEPTEEELAKGAFYSDAVLVMRDNLMECWYRFYIPNENLEKLYRKTSTDGVNWSSKETTFTIGIDTSTAQVLSPTIIYDEGKYKMWYVSHPTSARTGPRYVFYTESTDGRTNWSTPVQVIIKWKEGQPNLEPWHLDVSKKDGIYNMIINTSVWKNGRTISWATSDNETSFNNGKVILATPETGWDDGNLYRATLVYVDNNYTLYYGARNKNDFWQIGAVSGQAIDQMRPVMPYNQWGNILMNKLYVNDIDYRKNIFELLNNLAYFANDELQFSTRGEKSAKLANTEPNTVELLSIGNNDVGVFKAREMKMKRITVEREGSPNAAGIIAWGNEPNVLEIVTSEGQSGGSIRLHNVIFSGVNPNVEVEGALRYNKGLKKMQFYDGLDWRIIESS